MVGAHFPRRSIMYQPTSNTVNSLGLVPLVTKEEQLFWAEKIKPHVPHCISMYNSLMQHGHGFISHDTFYVQTTSHSIVCEKKIAPTIQNLSLFCLEEEVEQFVKVLRSASIIKWRDNSRVFVIHHLPPYLLKPLQRLAEQNGVKIKLTHCVVFTYDPQIDTQTLTIGQGLRVCRMGRTGVRQLSEKAWFSLGMSMELIYNMAQRVPFIGVYRNDALTKGTTVDALHLPVAGDEELPVSWVCSSQCGDVGKLGTEKDFRRCGLASLLTTVMARRQAALMGFIPHANVKTDNFPSLMMFSKNAGWNLTHEAFWVLSTKPESASNEKGCETTL